MEVDDAAAAAWYAAAAAEGSDEEAAEGAEEADAEAEGRAAGDADAAEGAEAGDAEEDPYGAAEADPYGAEEDPYLAEADPYAAGGDEAATDGGADGAAGAGGEAEAEAAPGTEADAADAGEAARGPQPAGEPPRKAQRTRAQASVAPGPRPGQAAAPEEARPRAQAAAALAEAFSAPGAGPALLEAEAEEGTFDASMLLEEVKDPDAAPTASDAAADGEAWGPDVMVVKQGQVHIALQHRTPPLDDGALLQFCDWLDGRIPGLVRDFPYVRRSGAYVDLSDNAIGPEGLGKLFTVLREHRVPLVVLKAYRNLLDDSIVDTLIEYLYTQPESFPMHGIHVSHNNITDKGAFRLIRAAAQCGHYPRYTSRLPLWLRLEFNAIDNAGRLLSECNNEKFNVCLMGDGMCSRPNCNHYSNVHVQLPYFFNQAEKGKQRSPDAPAAAPKMQPPPSQEADGAGADGATGQPAPKPTQAPDVEVADWAMQAAAGGDITEAALKDLKARETIAGVPAPKRLLVPKSGRVPRPAPAAPPAPPLDSLWPESDDPMPVEPPATAAPPPMQPPPGSMLVVGDGSTDSTTLGTRGKARGAPPAEAVVDLSDAGAEELAAGIGAEGRNVFNVFGRGGGRGGGGGRGAGRGCGGGGGWQGFGRSGGGGSGGFQNPYQAGFVPTTNKGGGGFGGGGFGGKGKGYGGGGGGHKPLWQGMTLDRKAKVDLKLEVGEDLGFMWRTTGEGHAPQVISAAPGSTVGAAVQVGWCLLRMNGLDAKMFNEKQIGDMLKQRPLTLRFGDE